MTDKIRIKIGDVCLVLDGRAENCKWALPPAYLPFVGGRNVDIRLRFHLGQPHIKPLEKRFDCPPIWSLYRRNGTSFFKIFDNRSFPDLERTLALLKNAEEADLYFAGKPAAPRGPFFGPAMELLMVNYLVRQQGVIVHACGVVQSGKGMLFVGESGAGKSTLANLWSREKGVTVLSDDRIIVRKKGREFRMYGTPWHGEAKFGSPKSAKLEGIYFLRHGQRNMLNAKTGAQPVANLLTCSFPPHWDPQGMASALDLFSNLAVQVPCQEFVFRPDRSALDFLQKTTLS